MALKNKHTLLLVDDERAITRALKRLFRKQGYGIMTAESGPEGLELLQETEEPVSMIISDQRMPEMNGAQFLEKAKTIFPNAIRYLLTGYSDMDAVIQAVNKKGKEFEMSLSNTCIECHDNKAEFCDRCHNYASVRPYCWDCHIDNPKEMK